MLIHASRWLVLHTRCNVVSCAYCKHLLSGVIHDISATHKLEPCGTPNSDVKIVEKCASNCTKCCRKVK